MAIVYTLNLSPEDHEKLVAMAAQTDRKTPDMLRHLIRTKAREMELPSAESRTTMGERRA